MSVPASAAGFNIQMKPSHRPPSAGGRPKGLSPIGRSIKRRVDGATYKNRTHFNTRFHLIVVPFFSLSFLRCHSFAIGLESILPELFGYPLRTTGI